MSNSPRKKLPSKYKNYSDEEINNLKKRVEIFIEILLESQSNSDSNLNLGVIDLNIDKNKNEK